MRLTFKIQPASRRLASRGGKATNYGKSPIEIILFDKDRKFKAITENTDLLLSTLDRLLKKNKIDIESLKDINVEIANGAGLTSTRIVLSISRALRFDLS